MKQVLDRAQIKRLNAVRFDFSGAQMAYFCTPNGDLLLSRFTPQEVVSLCGVTEIIPTLTVGELIQLISGDYILIQRIVDHAKTNCVELIEYDGVYIREYDMHEELIDNLFEAYMFVKINGDLFRGLKK